MNKLNSLEPQRVFHYFEEIAGIPHGSGDMVKIADYCVDFAKKHSFEYYRDNANNVVIYKKGTAGRENMEPVILQGHLDMVCQQTEDRSIDFTAEGLDLLVDGDFVSARGTTLGADNGIAVAMVLAILESDTLPHPPIEAVFTTDEEIGMVGAMALDMRVLRGRKMVNIDAEEDESMTVSCAGGSDFQALLPLTRITQKGTEITIILKNLQGGHSGVEIDKGRVNANMLAGRFLGYMTKTASFSIISIDGGDKGNAIPNLCKIRLCANEAKEFIANANDYLNTIKEEISAREKDFSFEISVGEYAEHNVFEPAIQGNLTYALLCAPNGIVEMSAEINGLVETSLNLGVLKTCDNEILFHFTLRSNKKSAIEFLESRLTAFFSAIPCQIKTFGHYPAWEFNSNSTLQGDYISAYKAVTSNEPAIEAIHAGLECGVFSSALSGLDCIAIGPQLFDVHTVREKMSISSVQKIYKILTTLLQNIKE